MGRGFSEGSGEDEAAGEPIVDDEPAENSTAAILDFGEWRARVRKAKARQAEKKYRRAKAKKFSKSSLSRLEHACAKAQFEAGYMAKEDYQHLCIINEWMD